MKTKEEVLSILKTHPNGNIEEPQFKKKFPEHYQILSTWDFPLILNSHKNYFTILMMTQN